RKALPEPELGGQAREYVAPRNEIEAQLCEIWQEVLGVAQVGVMDDFFLLGGHSLLATRVAAHVQQRLAVELTLAHVLTQATVRSLALQVQALQREALPPLLPAPQGSTPVLSFGQQRLWLLDHVEGGSAQYNVAGALRLHGALDTAALGEAVRQLVRRHEVLRTAVRLDEQGHPVPVLLPAEGFEVHDASLAALAPADREAALPGRLSEEARRPFDLASDFMLRVQVLTLDDEDHVLLVTLHHMASDGSSIEPLVRELSALYNGLVRQSPAAMPPMTLQYADYAQWQRQVLQGERLERLLGYWKQQLDGAPPVHGLPTDFPRRIDGSRQGGLWLSQWSREQVEALKRFCATRGATAFMGLHAAFSVWMARYAGSRDIVVGTPVANRGRAELAEMIGFFVNTLVLRLELQGELSFEAAVQRSRHALLEAYEHQQAPFELLVERLQPERSLAVSPLFQVMLALHEDRRDVPAFAGVQARYLERQPQTARYDLCLDVQERQGAWVLEWEFNRDLFSEATVQRFDATLRKLLEAALDQPGADVFGLPMLPAQEQALLQGFNATTRAFPHDARIHELFEAQAQQAPQALALSFEGHSLSYAELDEQANRVAQYLVHTCGVQRNELVGLCMERSLEMVVGLLGILKAGGAYVPLDPSYPAQRLAHMVQDSGARKVLMQQRLLGQVPVAEEQAVCLDAPQVQAQLASYAAVRPEVVGANAQDLAYVIYTSGSTGLPKGVLVEHRSVVNFLSAMAHAPGLGATDHLLAVTSPSFDIHGLELFLPLSLGARVTIASDEAVRSATLLAALMEQGGITAMQATPATWRLLVEEGWRPHRPMKLLCGGEALSASLAQQLLAMPGAQLWNLYGPTETTIWSCAQQVRQAGDALSIGRPIANTQIFIMGEGGGLAPLGAAGELCIAGLGLARGYLHREALTREKFVANPFHDEANPGSSPRMYRTGDLARWREDGTLEFLGRMDHQVKVRGFRIELGEIEAALAACEGVRQAVVLAREVAGDKKLVAYLTGEAEVAALREALRRRLPEYMVPALFVTLESLPLTPNGKLDRKALPEPELGADAQAYVAPRNEVEAQLCEIWQDVLGVARVGVTDNFFALGGSSLDATRITARVRQRWGLAPTVQKLFAQPTPEAVAAHLESLKQSALLQFDQQDALNEHEVEIQI
ncbi:amino acid adenylation domain-containing protein, partial [Pelomonas sp. BJYL3]|uniref:amino acid adenylation domain-containing protein n=1 Tax=Pelomonas sp. BJYL3 TaxID=2976697 RepID=UPI0022B5657B